ncbi:MAG: hypothetical protein J6B98_04215 [Bacilli bacterium]|nr:hypothetical protein [Bacilli bacterium]
MEEKIAQNEKPVEQAKTVKNKKRNKIFLILLIIVVLLVIGIVCYNQFFTGKKNDEKTNENDQKNITYKNYDDELLEIYHYQIDEVGYYNRDRVFKVGDEVLFRIGSANLDIYDIKEINYKIRYGDGLRLELEEEYSSSIIKFDKKDDTNVIKIKTKKNSGSYSMIFKEYTFFIKDGYDSSEMYFEIYDITFKTKNNKYYKHEDIKQNLILKSDKYYIYEDIEVDYPYLKISDIELNENYLEKVGEYKCDNKNCSYITYSGDFVLFDDYGLVAYNYKTKKVQELKYYGDAKATELVADNKIYGLIVEKDYNYGYYSLEKSKYIIPIKESISIYYDASYGYIEIRGEEWEIIDPCGNKYKPEISKLSNVEGTDFYYYTYYCGMEDCLYKFFTKDGNEIAKDKTFYGYTITNNKEILLIDTKNEEQANFEIYDSNANNIYTSKEYKSVHHLNYEDYLAVIDTDNYLKLINSKEEILATFTEMTEEKYFHDMISGWYEYDNKNGIYLVVEDPSVTVEEVLKNNKDFSESDIEWIKESSGYEYYYIPKTGETGKIPTAIGGYAKPVLYLYPKNDNTKINIAFEKPGLLTTTYPKFKGSWNVTANKNGDLYDNEGKYYYGLYWEEEGSTKVDFSEGFYVTKENAIEFLEEKLSIIGLSDRERNEFIMYWLPILEKNEKNLVYFELTEEREEFNKLNITPKPDSLLRMAIHVKKVNKKTNIKEQKLKTFERVGFTAVEWGGVIH